MADRFRDLHQMLISCIAEHGPSSFTDDVAAELANAEAEILAASRDASDQSQRYDALVANLKRVLTHGELGDDARHTRRHYMTGEGGKLHPEVSVVIRHLLSEAGENHASIAECKPDAH